jgi:hypothetical protein
MIIWLASYPRSGNTLLRTILRQSFGAYSYSIYDDRTDIARNPALGELVGHRPMGLPADEFVRRHLAGAETTFLKTHNAPANDGRAIYVVRDGRAAVVSYWNYLRRIRGREGLELADVIRGTDVHFGSWSESIQSWAPGTRPGTLMIRFEDLIADAMPAIKRIAAFTGLSPIAQWRSEFEKMQALYPEFFSTGSNRPNIEKMVGEDAALFWALHGDAMRAMGYRRGADEP